MAECLLSTGLPGMGDEHLSVGMSEYVLLWKPFGEFHIGWQSLHLFCLPFPDDLLFQFLENIEQQLPL